MNYLISAPISYSLKRAKTVDAKPHTKAEQALIDSVDALNAEWLEVGRNATDKLLAVISHGATLADVKSIIAQGIPLTILHAQASRQTAKTGAKGAPMLDADSNIILETVVHKQATKSMLLPFMPDVVTYSNATPPVELSRKPATVVSVPQWGGHAAWMI